MEDKFLSFVADVLNVDVKNISMDSKYGDVENWDSVMMLNLVMELEEEYGCSIPIEKITKGISLRELYNLTKTSDS